MGLVGLALIAAAAVPLRLVIAVTGLIGVIALLVANRTPLGYL
jgi:hypothetical protein